MKKIAKQYILTNRQMKDINKSLRSIAQILSVEES